MIVLLCPVCDGTQLREVEKNGVLIDICPSCKGVWLDRGELDKLMQDVHAAHAEYDQLQAYAADPRRKPHQPQQQYDPMPQSHYDPMPHTQSPYGYEPYKKQGYHPYKGDKKIHYDKYGRPYKKKKTVFHMLEDLFD